MKPLNSQTWGNSFGLCLTVFLLSYTVGVVPPMMPPMVREFDSSMGFIQSALVLMSLITASFIPTAENLSRRLGRKAVFAAALSIYAIGLVLIIISPTIAGFMLGLSGAIGLSAAALIGTPFTLMLMSPESKSRQLNLLALSLSSIVGTLVGSVLGGLFAAQLSWRWAFGVELLLVPAILMLVRQFPVGETRDTNVPIDWVGGLLSVCGFGFTLVGISLAGVYGWWEPIATPPIFKDLLTPFGISIVPVCILSGAICLGLLVYWQRQLVRAGQPSLLRMGVFARRGYVVGLAIGTLHTAISSGLRFNLFQFLPVVVGLNTLQTALTVMSSTVAQLVVLIGLLKYRNKFRPRTILQMGLVLECVGLMLLFPAFGSSSGSTVSVLLPLVLFGMGMGLFVLFITSLTFSATAVEEKAEARGIYRPFQQLGASLGRGVLGTILVGFASTKIVDGLIANWDRSFSDSARSQVISLVRRAIQTFTKDERSALVSELPDSVRDNFGSIVNLAATEAMQITLGIILALSLLCLMASFLLPKNITQFEVPIE
ncbi:MAG: MFS transporter [Synechococcus sp.]